ncbi:MAG: hypothetical protein DKINENOH_05113 [bacterium]|nr:hypothetical protein [bacterium]
MRQFFMILTRQTRALTVFLAFLLTIPVSLGAQTAQLQPRGAFASYEITEMAVNNFRNFAGEAGFRFDQKHQVRLTVMEVAVSERDLAGWWSAAVEGKGVEGYLRVYEMSVDRFFGGNWYYGANAGYIANEFRHVTLLQRIWNETLTAGIAIGYSRANLFGIRRLHINLTMPVRFYFNGIEETKLGDATVRTHKIVPNTWLFIGYKF